MKSLPIDLQMQIAQIDWMKQSVPQTGLKPYLSIKADQAILEEPFIKDPMDRAVVSTPSYIPFSKAEFLAAFATKSPQKRPQ